MPLTHDPTPVPEPPMPDLSRARFEAWLRTLRADRPAGVRNDGAHCPVARFLQSQPDGIEAIPWVEPTRILWFNVSLPCPEWMNAFICLTDDRAAQSSTMDEQVMVPEAFAILRLLP